MKRPSLTTDARLRHARAALRQAATLLRDAATLGTVSPLVAGMLRQLANDCEESAVYAAGLRIQCARDLDAVRAAKRKRRAA